MPAGDQQPIELLTNEEAWRLEPVRVANERGHDVRPDHCTQERYTCWRPNCLRAVLRVGTNIYGSAVREDCTP